MRSDWIMAGGKELEISAQNGHIEIVDYLRGFSIFTIVIMHIIQNFVLSGPDWLLTLSSIGGSGVHVFFLCSGIGLYMSYLKQKTTFGQFMKKRFTKIYLPYILVVIVSFFIPYLYQHEDRFRALLSHIFLYKMFIPKYESSFGAQFWFISTIIQFYLLFIPMCRIKEKCRSNGCFVGLFMAVSVAWWIFISLIGKNSVRVWNSFCFQYIWEFAIGMCLGEYLFKGNVIRIKKWLLILFAVVGIGLQGVMALSSSVFKTFNDIPALIGYLFLALLLYDLAFVKRMGNMVSKSSYELYLVHMLVITTVFQLIRPGSFLTQIAVGILSLAVSMIAAVGYRKLRKIIRI